MEKNTYHTELKKENPVLKLNKKDFINLDSAHLPVKEVTELNLENKIDVNNELLVLSPMIIDAITNNPFRVKERQYPVDFSYPVEETYIINILIPQNYQIDEKPSPINIAMPDNDAKFSYIINILNGNNIQLTAKLSIKKTLFSQDEYPDLQEFYTQMIKKNERASRPKKIYLPMICTALSMLFIFAVLVSSAWLLKLILMNMRMPPLLKR